MTVINRGSRYLWYSPTGPRTWDTGAAPPPPPPTTYRAIVTVGESTTGASALTNTVASSLLTPDPRIQILIPPGDAVFPAQAGTFQTLAVGVNNNTSHLGADPTYCAWEIGFRPHLDANPSIPTPIYYCQGGQGGSLLSAWHTTTGYALDILRVRIATMKALFTAMGITVAWDIFLALGINDLIDGVITPSALQSGMIQLANDVRAEIGVGTAARVSMPQLMSYWQTNAPAHCAALEELDTLMTNFRIISTADLNGNMRDQNHFGPVSNEILGGRMLAA